MVLLVEELERLKTIILHMAEHTRNVIEKTAKLFSEIDPNARKRLWDEIDNMSSLLDRVRREFVNEVLTFMAKRQPLGKELLTAQTLLSIAYDVYRISRYCREIARIDSMLAPSSGVWQIEGIATMFSKAAKAVEKALEDLVKLRPSNIEEILRIDSEVDEYYKKLIMDVVSSTIVDRLTTLKVLIMRHIERIVDHANYIEDYLSDLA